MNELNESSILLFHFSFTPLLACWIASSHFWMFCSQPVDPEKTKRLEITLNDWLNSHPDGEYIQGMLALGGVLVMVVDDRELRHDIFNIHKLEQTNPKQIH